jgi:RHS repeat-associated protein
VLSGGTYYGTGTVYNGWDPLAIAPHWDYQGYGVDHAFYGPTSPINSNGVLVWILWPSPSAYNEIAPGDLADNNGWFGSLLLDQRDGTGNIYRRNRYYDPQTARFTQEDPIGLGGGLNLYGFAQGDPVNFKDPMGLCLEDLCIGESIAIAVGVKVAVRAIYNLFVHRPAGEGLVQETQQGLAIGVGGAGVVAGSRVLLSSASMVLASRAAAAAPVAANLDEIVQEAKAASQVMGPRIMALAQRISNLGLGRDRAVATLAAGLQRIGAEFGEATIEGRTYFFEGMIKNMDKVNALTIDPSGTITRATLRLVGTTWQVVH